jgi:lipoprotein-anchoring transpeptidase ErfK/SrfK
METARLPCPIVVYANLPIGVRLAFYCVVQATVQGVSMRVPVIAAAVAALISSASAEPALFGSSDETQNARRMVMETSAQQPQVQSALGGGFIEFIFGDAGQRSRNGSQTWFGEPPHRDYYGREQSTQPVYASRAPVDPRLEQQAAGDQIEPRFQRQQVSYSGTEKPGTIVIDTPNHFLYLVEGDGRAMRYGIGVGRPGFTWSGVHAVSAKREWPDWVPPDEMLKRQPYLPHFVAGGPGNPLGARALYLGSTIYRIHGSNEPWTIGKNVSSGCIRMRNADVEDLYERVKVGTKVIVL